MPINIFFFLLPPCSSVPALCFVGSGSGSEGGGNYDENGNSYDDDDDDEHSYRSGDRGDHNDGGRGGLEAGGVTIKVEPKAGM